MMGTVRTTITLPADVLELLDEIAGPRGRSSYIAEVVGRQLRHERARRIWAENFGVLKGSTSWGATPEETARILRDLRDSSERDRRIWGEDPT